MESAQLVKEICKCLSSKKAYDITSVYVADKTIIADYFVIASGRSATQVRALCESVEESAEKAGGVLKRREGVQEGRWAVLDFGDVIVHIFHDEQRLFYHLERIWGEGEKFVEEESDN